MPTWGEILVELNQLKQPHGNVRFDIVRRKYLQQLSEYTCRNLILYATKWTESGSLPPDSISINEQDIQAFMEVFHGLPSKPLDIILHSPGGSAEATEALVSYIRSKFSDVRVIIPYAAMSAATMLACSANRIVMGKHSFLGPIDPQMIVNTPLGPQAIPAHAILDQFTLAKSECSDPTKLGAWLPMLSQYGPALLVQCTNAIELSKRLVGDWLQKYMFKDQSEREESAKSIADSLSDHRNFRSHRRHISREEAKRLKLVIDDLESDQTLQDLVLSIFHATTHTFNGTAAVKIVENQLGKAFVHTVQPIIVAEQVPSKPSPSPPLEGKPPVQSQQV